MFNEYVVGISKKTAGCGSWAKEWDDEEKYSISRGGSSDHRTVTPSLHVSCLRINVTAGGKWFTRYLAIREAHFVKGQGWNTTSKKLLSKFCHQVVAEAFKRNPAMLDEIIESATERGKYEGRSEVQTAIREALNIR